MDLYQVCVTLGLNPSVQWQRVKACALLKSHGVRPIRRNYYDAHAVQAFARLYKAGLHDRRRVKNPAPKGTRTDKKE